MCSSSEVYYSLVKKPRSTSVARRCITYHIAILVPELKKIVYDTECAWGLISSPEQMTDVTEEELNAEICKRLKENELDFFAKYFGGK